MLPWNEIDTVFLDMDGTLLDLHFDNYFWLEYLPACVAKRDGLTLNAAKAQLMEHYQEVFGQLNWYCLDYWADRLQVDIVALKHQVDDKIALREDAESFLEWLKNENKCIVLATNAHRGSLDLKMQRTGLSHYFDHLVSSHDFGVAKEHIDFWKNMQGVVDFNAQRSVFIDDNANMLEVAQEFGIAHNLAILKPDSRAKNKAEEGFFQIDQFSGLYANKN